MAWLEKMHYFPGTQSTFPSRIPKFPTISYVFLYFKDQDFPPNVKISWERGSWVPHFFQAWLPISHLVQVIACLHYLVCNNNFYYIAFLHSDQSVNIDNNYYCQQGSHQKHVASTIQPYSLTTSYNNNIVKAILRDVIGELKFYFSNELFSWYINFM